MRPSLYTFLGSTFLLMIVIPTVLMSPVWFPNFGIDIHIVRPLNFRNESLVISVHRTGLVLNGKPVEPGALTAAIRSEFSRRADHIVYIEGDADLEFGDVARVIDMARTAWPGVPVVLLTRRP